VAEFTLPEVEQARPLQVEQARPLQVEQARPLQYVIIYDALYN